MDNVCTIVSETISWMRQIERVPLAYIAEDRTPVHTGSRPLLEFGFHVEGDETELRVGDLRTVSLPGTVHILNAHVGNTGVPQGHWGYWCLSFDVSQSCPLSELTRGPLLLSSPVHHRLALRRCYEAVAWESIRPGVCQHERLRGVILRLLGELYENVAVPTNKRAPYSSAVERAIRYIHDSYSNPTLSLSDIAIQAGLSPSHFGRLFRQETGQTPIGYLQHARFARAQELLERTRLNISEIAGETGYSDSLYFSRVFHKLCGVSPRSYRQRHDWDTSQ